MLALTKDGRITECHANQVGYGRCNHIAHNENGNMKEFINQINKDREYIPPTRRKLKEDYKDKKELSGNFKSCQFIDESEFENLTKKLKEQENTFHNDYDNNKRNYLVDNYEKEFSGIPCEIFLVDRGHKDGEELHIIKNNGIICIYNKRKLESGENSRITKLIARPSQLKRYYRWNDCQTPKYLLNIAQTNQELGRNNW